MPSTSRSFNENLENTRSESKKRLNRDTDPEDAQPSKSKKQKINKDLQNSEEVPQSKSKKPKRSKDLEGLSDEAKSAEVSELIESAGEMGKNMDEFVRNSMEICNRNRHGRQERNPTTSQ